MLIVVPVVIFALPAGDGLRLRITDPVTALPELAKVYDAVLPSRPGFIGRNETWWRGPVYDPPDRRQGTSPLHCLVAEDDSGPRGYALYSAVHRWDTETTLPDNALTVREMVCADAGLPLLHVKLKGKHPSRTDKVCWQ